VQHHRKETLVWCGRAWETTLDIKHVACQSYTLSKITGEFGENVTHCSTCLHVTFTRLITTVSCVRDRVEYSYCTCLLLHQSIRLCSMPWSLRICVAQPALIVFINIFIITIVIAMLISSLSLHFVCLAHWIIMYALKFVDNTILAGFNIITQHSNTAWLVQVDN